MNQQAIFIFTHNDSVKLENILKELSKTRNYYDIHVVDDSSVKSSITNNIELTSTISDNIYLGQNAFKDFYKTNLIEEKRENEVIGTSNWNLGTARNFALDYSIVNKFEKVLFVDDDISEITLEKLDLGFNALTDDNFVSCFLEGKIDDSFVGHIARQLNVVYEEPRMLSGGFWFLSPNAISHRFYNIYNEDWILQLLESKKERIKLPFTVIHDKTAKAKKKYEDIYFQEIGEILVEGLLEDSEAVSRDTEFWEIIISDRIEYIKELIANANTLNRTKEVFILNKLQNWLYKLTGQTILNTLNKNKYERTEY